MNKKIKIWLAPHWSFLKKTTKPIQRLLLRPLKKLRVSSEIIGPPKGFHKSTQAWIAKCNSTSEIKIRGVTYTEIYPAHQICRAAPKTLEQDVHWKFKQEYRRESPATFVAVVPGGRVWGDSGTVISPDDKVLEDVSVEHGNTIDSHSIFFQWKLPSVHQVDGTVGVLSAAGSGGYHHWMFDVLPRVDLIRRSGIFIESIDKFIVNKYQFPFQKETLTSLGIPATKIIESRRYPHVKASQLVVPSLPGHPGNMPYWACDFLKKEFLDNKNYDHFDRIERIYLSRDNANHRRIINNAELTNFLSRLGFKSLILETMTIAEQALLFSSAKVIVAPHGAGLSNLVFCSPETKVIEIFSPNYVNVCFWSLSNQMDLEYYYLLGEGRKPPEHIDPHQIKADISVNIDSLSNLMNLAGIN
jgi:capsular polysaccharide biosynthesis protein